MSLVPPEILRRLPPAEALQKQTTKWRGVGRGRPRHAAVPGPGQQSVWDFPRPPRLEAVARPLRVIFAGKTIAETHRGLRICETAGAPVYYFPPDDVRAEYLQAAADGISVCEWKGAAVYFDLMVGADRSDKAAFCYPEPFTDLGEGYDAIAGWPAFYASRVDAAFVGDEQVTPQPGGFYAGWVTADLTGPIKGAPGTEGW